ncbi:MAG: flagellar hook-length control protein FliK [Desulfobacterium sp.]|nr:flagellar hook-length control protein FliK [Desulfobacterium sp.]
MNQGVQIFAPDLARQLRGDGKTLLPALAKGRTVDATVLKVLSSSRAEILVAGKRLTADTAIGLIAGQTLELKVTGPGGFEIVKPTTENLTPPSLINIPSATGSTSTLPGFLSAALGALTDKNPFASLVFSESHPVPPGPEFDRLKELLVSAALKSDAPDHGFILRVLGRSRQLLDQSIAILSRGDSGKGEVHKSVGDFIDAMEKFQTLNSQSSDNARYLIPFPILDQRIFTFGQLFLDLGARQEKPGTKGGRLVRASLFLTMTNLGDLRVDLSVLNTEIAAVFQVADEGVARFIRTMVPTLKERLTTQGFKVLQVECRREKPELLSQASLADIFVEKESSSLNLIV